MKHYLLILLFTITAVQAQDKIDPEKEALQKLVKEREQKFGNYARAAEAKSGFFGNQTKKDIRSANNVLVEIIKLDNRIIFLLNNFLDYRNFQKTEMTFSHKDQSEKINELNLITDNLVKKSSDLNDTNKKLSKKLLQARILNYILLFFCMVVGIILFRKKIPLRNT